MMAPSRAVIHIGMPKAASTVLQAWLEATKDQWAALGVLALDGARGALGESIEGVLGSTFHDWNGSLLAQLVDERAPAGPENSGSPSLVLSSEGLSAASPAAAKSFLEWLATRYAEVTLEIGYRSSLSSSISSWQQAVRMGSPLSLSSHALEFAQDYAAPDGHSAPDYVLSRWLDSLDTSGRAHATYIAARDESPGGPLATRVVNMFPEFESDARLALLEVPPAHGRTNASGSLVLTEAVRRLNETGHGIVTFLRHADVWDKDSAIAYSHLSQQVERRLVAVESELGAVMDEYAEVSEWSLWKEFDLRVHAALAPFRHAKVGEDG